MMRSTFKVMFFACLLGVPMAIGQGQPAEAQLTAIGQFNPVTGFPASIRDQNGLSLGLCDELGPDGIASAEEPPCIPATIALDGSGGLVRGNIEEALFYGATSVFDGAVGQSFLSICAVEAAGGPVAGGELLINFALIRLQGLTPGLTYTATTPCGVLSGVADATGEVRAELSLSGAPELFAGTLLGPVHMFASNGTGAAGFLGDGITPGALQSPIQAGGPLTVRVTGPDIDISNNQFTVVGKVFSLAPVVVPPPPVTFKRDNAGNGNVVFKFNAPPFSATAQAIGVGTPLPGEPILLTLANGQFTGTVPIVAATVLPAEVQVTFNLGIAGQTIQNLPLTERVGGPVPLLLME